MSGVVGVALVGVGVVLFLFGRRSLVRFQRVRSAAVRAAFDREAYEEVREALDMRPRAVQGVVMIGAFMAAGVCAGAGVSMLLPA